MDIDVSTPEKLRRVLIIGFILLSIVTGAITYAIYYAIRPSSPTTTGKITKDATTGYDIETDDGRMPETYGINPATPLLLGFEKLIEQGVVLEDLQKYQLVTTNFILNDKEFPPQTKVSLANPSCGIPDENGFVTCKSSLVINDKAGYSSELISDHSGLIQAKYYYQQKLIAEEKG